MGLKSCSSLLRLTYNFWTPFWTPLLDPKHTLLPMALGSLNLRQSGTDHTPTTTNGLIKGRMAQALCNGLALSFELSILVLLLFLRFVELGESLAVPLRMRSDKRLPFVVSTRCLAVFAQSANLPRSEPKALSNHRVLSLCSPIFEESATASQKRGMPTPTGRLRFA
jgi:hypothetical protein